MKKMVFIFAFAMIANYGFSQTTTYSKDAWGNTVAKDKNGRTQSTYSKDAWGNTVEKDKNGKTKGTYTKDAWGNTFYTPQR